MNVMVIEAYGFEAAREHPAAGTGEGLVGFEFGAAGEFPDHCQLCATPCRRWLGGHALA
jgi:hypothetical protein